MKNPQFNFKKHQNFSKSWKMLVRFLIYSVVIAVLLYLIYNPNESSKNPSNESEIEQIDMENDGILID